MNPINRCLTRCAAAFALTVSVSLHADVGSLLAHYALTHNFSDSSGAGLTSLEEYGTTGFSEFTSSGWTWNEASSSRGLKLTLDTANPLEGFSIAFTFSIQANPVYIKMVDFASLTADKGVYLHSQRPIAYGASNESSGYVPLNTLTHFVFTRDTDGAIALYQDGGLVASAMDSDGDFLLGPITYLFVDDFYGSSSEYATGGSLRNLKLWDYALGSTEVAQEALAASAIPEPSTYALIIGSIGLVGAAAWRRRAARLD